MNTNLRSIHWRLRRARKHLNDFDRKATIFINNRPYKMITEIDTDGVNQFMRYKLQGGKKLPPSLCYIAGDCIHNLRSALDNIIFQFGKISGCPKRTLDKLSFPTCDRPSDWQSKRKLFNTFPQSVVDLIESFQPYKPYKGGNDPYSHPIWVLNRLWCDDKHRSPILIVTFHRGTSIIPSEGVFKDIQDIKKSDGRTLRVFSFTPPEPMSIHTGGRCEDGKEIITIPFRAGDPKPKFNVNVSFDIAFGEDTPAKGQPASKYLRNLYNFVADEVYPPFKDIFPK